MSDLLLAWCIFSAVTAASTVAAYWVIRKLHTSRYPDRVELYFVVVMAASVLCVLAFKVVEGLLR